MLNLAPIILFSRLVSLTNLGFVPATSQYLNTQDDRVMEYRGAIGATELSDISQQIQMLVNSTRDRIITDIGDCCNYKYQILDTFCASQSSVNTLSV